MVTTRAPDLGPVIASLVGASDVGSRLSRFVLASGEIVADNPRLRQQPGCGVELTAIRTQGQHWWSIGFEASGPSDLLRSELAAAALVFAQPAPAVEPSTDEFASYPQWLAHMG